MITEQKEMRRLVKIMARQIKVARKRKGYTQVRLAQESGVELRHLQRIEAGTVDIRLGTVERISETLKVSPDSFFQDPLACAVAVNDMEELGLYQLLDLANFGFKVLDREGMIRYSNRFWAKMVGYEPEELINKVNIKELMSSASTQNEVAEFLRFISSTKPEPAPVILSYRSKNQRVVWTRMQYNYITNLNREVIGFVSGVSEIVEPKSEELETIVTKSGLVSYLT